MSASISSIRAIGSGGLIASFEVNVTIGNFAEAVTFEALLMHGPFGYFVVPAGVRDSTGAWQARMWLTRGFAKALCSHVVRELKLEEHPAGTDV